MTHPQTMDIRRILDLLPHRYPFLLVDRVVECVPGSHIHAYKNITFNEPFFQGHFPGHPVMPGVLELEAMAQTAGVLLNKTMKKEGGIAYYMGVDGARFRRTVHPGDTLRMEVVLLKTRLNMYKLHGNAFVGDELACEADMMFASKED